MSLLLLALTVPLLQDAPPAKVPMTWTGVLDEAAFAALHDLKEGPAPPLAGRDVTFEGGRGYLSRPPAGKALGAVLVLHEWWGLNDHVKHWTDRIAADGYDALAVDLYSGKVATTRDEAMAAMRAVDEGAALATLRAAHRHLVTAPEIAAVRTASIGWCFGGAWSLRLAVAEPELDAAVIYYGRLIDDAAQLAPLKAPVLGVFGDQDTGIPPAAVASFAEAMKAAGKSLELRRYDAHHAFANPSGGRYHAEHAAAAWLETRAFLARHLAPPQPEGSFTAGTRKVVAAAPEGWTRGADRNMRLATFTFGSACECVVSAFPGDVGGLHANVNRWRQQVGLGPLEASALPTLPRVPMFGQLATLVEAEGRIGERPSLLLGTIAPLAGETVFVKLTGPTDEVRAALPHFLALCRSLE